MKKFSQLKALYLFMSLSFFSGLLFSHHLEIGKAPKMYKKNLVFNEDRKKAIMLKRVNITPDLLVFYVQKNFRFMTRAPNRPPTLYFEDAHGNMGRLRQGHGLGKSLVFAAANIHPQRVFLSQELVAAFMANPQDGPDWVEAASLFPAIGEKVFEFFGNWDPLTNHYQNDHGSSGNICKNRWTYAEFQYL